MCVRKAGICTALVLLCGVVFGCGQNDRIQEDFFQEPLPAKVSMDMQRIEERCYEVELEGQGKVTFLSYAPNQNVEKMGDVIFELEREGEEPYRFPYVMAGNRRPQQSFVQIQDVRFQDYDKDGNTDVLILTEYQPLTDYGEENVMRIRLYRNDPEQKEFILDTERMDMLNRNQWNHTMDEVLEHMGDAESRLLLKFLTDAIEDF